MVKDRARVPRRYLPYRPAGLPEGLGGRQRRQYQHPAGSDRILATPTGVSKGMMQPDDLIIVDMKGNKISGPR